MIVKNNGTVDPYQKVSIEQVEGMKKNPIDTQAKTEINAINAKNDTISLSEDAKLRTLAYTEAMNAPDVRTDKVSSVRDHVQSGNYSTDSLKIAKAMMSDLFADSVMYA